MDNNNITSYGIILIYYDENNHKLYYLLSQRRDTIEYTDYLKGKYLLNNLKTYFSLMTQNERHRLLTYNFDELWNDLWINHNCKAYNDKYMGAKAKFLNNYDYMKNILNSTQNNVYEPIWGFPKGKKNSFENVIDCALREFKEETKMQLTWKNLMNLSPFTEVFKGSNNLNYQTIYYIACSTSKTEIIKNIYNPKGFRSCSISEEISELEWCTLNESKQKLSQQRFNLLQNLENDIKKIIAKNNNSLI